jgi:hypothetical protein
MNYKRNKRILLFAIIIIVAIFIVFICYSPSANKAKQNVINSERVKIGMSKFAVLQIMGEPDAKRISFFNATDTMYYYEPPFAASEGIYIQFEDSSGKVNQIIPYE